jgi:hypothetical protein
MSKGDRSSLTQSQKCQMLVDNDPKQIGTCSFQNIVLDFFKEHLMAYLDTTLVKKQASNLDKYKKVMKKIR